MQRTGFKNKQRTPLKRTGFKNTGSSLRRTPLKRGTSQMKRTRIRVVGKSTASELKRDIQALLREIVIIRDGGCLLRVVGETGSCGGYRKDGELILQAEHLHTRANGASYADPRLVICLCKRHHSYYKPQHSDEYYRIVKELIGKERTALLKAVKEDRGTHKMDWELEKIALEIHLKKISLEHE